MNMIFRSAAVFILRGRGANPAPQPSCFLIECRAWDQYLAELKYCDMSFLFNVVLISCNEELMQFLNVHAIAAYISSTLFIKIHQIMTVQNLIQLKQTSTTHFQQK